MAVQLMRSSICASSDKNREKRPPPRSPSSKKPIHHRKARELRCCTVRPTPPRPRPLSAESGSKGGEGRGLGARDEAMRANERATRERASEGVLRVDETVCRSAQARPRGPANVLRPSGWRRMRPAQLGQRAAGRWGAWGRGPLFALSERTNTPCQRAPPPQYGQLAQCELSGQ